MCEERASRELERLKKWSFWEGGLEAVERGLPDTESAEVGEEQKEREEKEWEGEVRGVLEALKGVSVVEGYVFLGRGLVGIRDEIDADHLLLWFWQATSRPCVPLLAITYHTGRHRYPAQDVCGGSEKWGLHA